MYGLYLINRHENGDCTPEWESDIEEDGLPGELYYDWEGLGVYHDVYESKESFENGDLPIGWLKERVND